MVYQPIINVQLLIYLGLASLVCGTVCEYPYGKIFGFYVISDTNNMVEGPDVSEVTNAVQVYTPSTWTASIPGAMWIWDAPIVFDPGTEQTVYVSNSLYIPGTPSVGVLEIAVAGSALIFINGKTGFCDVSEAFMKSTQVTCNILPYLVPGLNNLEFNVESYPSRGGSNQIESAGVMYKITIKALVF